MRWSIPQNLQQQGESDCSVPVFAALAGIRQEDLLRDLPHAPEAKVTVHEWEEWLNSRGFRVSRFSHDEKYTVPCAHLVEFGGMPHWIYENDTGVHDPNPAFQYVPANHPNMLNLSYYQKRFLTVSIT